MKWMYRLITCLFLIVAYSATVQAQQCIAELMPIGEAELLDVGKRWPDALRITDSVRLAVATACGYADSTGAVNDDLVVKELIRCELTGGSEADTIVAIYIKGTEGDKDESIYLLVVRNALFISQSLVAQLQTTCEATYLSGCTMQDDGSILVQQLKHAFECGTDEFLGTTKLPSFAVGIREDHTFEQILSDIVPREGE